MNPSGIAVLLSHRIAGGGGSFQLQDTFSGSSKDTSKWDATTRLPTWTASTLGGTDTESAGVVQITPTISATRIEGRSSVTLNYTLVGKELVVSMPSGPNTTCSVTFGYLHAANRGGTNIRWTIDNNFGTVTINAQFSNFGSNGTTFSATYNATTHYWFRIRESGSDIYWDTAPDSGGSPGTWVNRRQLSVDGGTPGSYFAPNAGDVGVWVDNYNSNATPITTQFGEFYLTA
jgi:hypothetical protein